MAGTAAANRPPGACQGPNGGNSRSSANTGATNSVQQDPGLQGISQDPGPPPHPQHPAFARPVFYVHAPPPPPFLHYQWPMPFSYNPFGGFPGMGYGMVMPSFPPPPPYMEPPAYILPHPHIQPVDYRRMLHPQAPAPGLPHQNPNQTRRVRMPPAASVRETVNSEVQTEPTLRGIGGYDDGGPHAGSDSGHGTASNSPSSSSSSSHKQGLTEVKNNTLPHSNAKDSQDVSNSAIKRGFNMVHATEMNTVQSSIRATQETQKRCKSTSQDLPLIPPYRNSPCNTWSVSSADSMVPVFSSSQKEDNTVKERRISVPDILMSWRGSTPPTPVKMADKVLPQRDHQLPSYETEVTDGKSPNRSPTETHKVPVVGDDVAVNDDAQGSLNSEDGQMPFKILRPPSTALEPFSRATVDNEPVRSAGSVRCCLTYREEQLHSLNTSHKLPDSEQENGNETSPHEDTTEIIPYQTSLNNYQMKRKMNESVWSVESLLPYIPSKEWLLQNVTLEPEVIVEMMEEAEKFKRSTKNDDQTVESLKERRKTRRFSSSDSVPMLHSSLIFSTPAEKRSPPKKPKMDGEREPEPEQGQTMAPSEKDSLASPPLRSKISSTQTGENVDESGSSEPEAIHSPNQESLIVNELQEKSPRPPEMEEMLLLNSAAEEKISSTDQLILQNEVSTEVGTGAVNQLSKEKLCVPMADQRLAEVSPSKGHLVDCAVQCTVLQGHKCCCEGLKCSTGPNKWHPPKYSDMKRTNNGKADVLCVNEHIQKHPRKNSQWRNRGQAGRNSSQQEAFRGYNAKPGKLKGGY